MKLGVVGVFYYHFGMVGTGHRSGQIYQGCPDHYLLMHFRTDFFIEVNGKVSYGKAGDYVLHAPNTAVAHGSRNKRVGFVNDWIFFHADSSEVPFLEQLPFDRPIPEGSNDDFANCLSSIIDENIRHDAFSDGLISNSIYRLLTMLKRAETDHIKDGNALYRQFNQLRMDFCKHCHRKWTLEEMAACSGYSVSHFSALYKRFFGISPIDDLLNQRINLAKHLIGLKTYTVSEVARMCGFSSLHYFSEYFKKRTGKSPTEY